MRQAFSKQAYCMQAVHVHVYSYSHKAMYGAICSVPCQCSLSLCFLYSHVIVA